MLAVIESDFSRLAASQVDYRGNHDPKIVWFNAAQQDLDDSTRYMTWRVFDSQAPGPLPDENWHPRHTLSNGEVLLARHTHDPTHGFEHELGFSTNQEDPTCSLHNIRFGIVDPSSAAIYEVHLPWIGNVSEENASHAYKVFAADPNPEISTNLLMILNLYQSRRDKLRRFNMPRLGAVSPSGLIALGATIKLLHEHGTRQIYMPVTLPVRHARYSHEESTHFHSQARSLFTKAGASIQGATISSTPDSSGYLALSLDTQLASQHPLLHNIFA